MANERHAKDGQCQVGSGRSAVPRSAPPQAPPQRHTDEPGQLAEAPGHVHGQHGTVALLQGDVAQVVGEAAEALGDAGVAQVQQHVEAQRLEGGEVQLPVGVVKLDARRVLLILGQAQHLQVVVTHEVLGLIGVTLCPRLGLQEMGG